jgi:hypothetical protein
MRQEWCGLAIAVGLLLTSATAAFGGQPAVVPPMNFYFDRQPPAQLPNQFGGGSGLLHYTPRPGNASGDRFRPNCSSSENSPGLLVRCERQAREDAAQQRDDSCNRRYSSDRKARERCLGAKP